MPPRKYESGSQKRNKKRKLEVLINSQKGSLDKFVINEPKVPLVEPVDDVPIENNNVDVDDINNVNVDLVSDMPIAENVDDVDNIFDDVPSVNCNVDDVPIENDNNAENIDDMPSDNDNVDHRETSYVPNIYDPRVWDGLDSKMIDLLVKNGPKRDNSIVKGPKDKSSRRFTANLYTRVLSNGEKCDRDWLVYSKELDRVYCFCCKIFKKRDGKRTIDK